jgi:hypothetical protein
MTPAIAMVLMAESRPMYWNQPRCAPLTYTVGLLRPLGQCATHARLQSFFYDDFLEDVPIKTEISNQPLQLAVLFSKLASLAGVRSASGFWVWVNH